MPIRIYAALPPLILASCCSMAGAAQTPPPDCTHDRARLLALDEQAFDQDLSGGWRALSSKPGCELVAADLLRDYREAHHKDSGLLFWHEAQVRAGAGQTLEAIALMQKSYKPAADDKSGWNVYVDATIAFLRKDRAALQQAKSKLASVAPPTGAGAPPVVDGYMEVVFADGAKRKIRWPPNIDVVEGLEQCFDKPYFDAYANECRPKKP